jgi:hypothetical protein
MVNPNVIRNVYVDRTVVVTTVNRTSYNGGRGGLTYRPNAREVTVVHQQHYVATPAQRQSASAAAADRSNLNGVNRGNPGAVHTEAATKPAPAAKPATRPAAANPAPKQPQHQAAAKPPQQKPPAKQDKPAGGDKPQTPPIR